MSSTSSGVGGGDDDVGPLVATLQQGDRGGAKTARTCAASPDGKVWVTAGAGGVIKVWDAATRACVRTLPADAAHGASYVRCAKFSPDGSRLATASKDKTVAIWKVSTWEVERVLRGHTDAVSSCNWSSTGAWLVTGSYKTVKVWRVADGSVVLTLKGHTNWVYDVCCSPDDTMVASASADHTVQLWRVAVVGGATASGDGDSGDGEGRCVRTIRHPSTVW